MISFLKKYILPKEIDFFEAMLKHSKAIESIVKNLELCFLEIDKKACERVLNDESNSKEIKKQNIKNLLGTFITPIDRESIYRVTTELDWTAISIRHFILEVNSYKIENLKEYNLIFHSLNDMAKALTLGFKNLKEKKLQDVDRECDEVRSIYDKIVSEYILYMAKLSKQSDIETIFTHKEILFQLKDIAKRFHICANSLEDIVAKMI